MEPQAVCNYLVRFLPLNPHHFISGRYHRLFVLQNIDKRWSHCDTLPSHKRGYAMVACLIIVLRYYVWTVLWLVFPLQPLGNEEWLYSAKQRKHANGHFLSDGGKLLYLVNARGILIHFVPCPKRSYAMSSWENLFKNSFYLGTFCPFQYFLIWTDSLLWNAMLRKVEDRLLKWL